jgi:hypothetical protein
MLKVMAFLVKKQGLDTSELIDWRRSPALTR